MGTDAMPRPALLRISESSAPHSIEAVMDGVVKFPGNRAIVLKNKTCPYCGKAFGEELPATKEHVVARNFVPRGCFDGQWNLILRACEPCNRDKAKLEDDISAITMQPDVFGQLACEDPRLSVESARKAKATSRRTGRRVSDSRERIILQQPLAVGNLTLNLEAPPQIEPERIWKLAHYHWRGFFYFDTYDTETRRGGFLIGDFMPVLTVPRRDWGHVRMRAFMAEVQTWELRIHAIGADGFFKFLIRRHPEGLPVWCWALEWNQNQRIIGFAGDREVISKICAGFPIPEVTLIQGDERHRWTMRQQVPLEQAADDLFDCTFEGEIFENLRSAWPEANASAAPN